MKITELVCKSTIYKGHTRVTNHTPRIKFKPAPMCLGIENNKSPNLPDKIIRVISVLSCRIINFF